MADLMVTEGSDEPSPAADASGLSLMERRSERPKEWPLELMFHMD
jgi:hypothetical protein